MQLSLFLVYVFLPPSTVTHPRRFQIVDFKNFSENILTWSFSTQTIHRSLFLCHFEVSIDSFNVQWHLSSVNHVCHFY